jgi:tRNA threonylcarbamoyladenosine biosynthesis protein TsaE
LAGASQPGVRPGPAPFQPPILLLSGGLGAGKTCLVQGLAAELGIDEAITSPTFALAQHYQGQGSAGPTALVHLDLYRLELAAAADDLFAQEEEEAAALGALLAVEWPERLGFWPQGAWQVELQLEGEGRLALVTRPQLGAPGGPPGPGVAAGPQ